MNRMPIAMWLPVLAALFIATVAGGLGVIFMVLKGTAGDWMADHISRKWENAPIIILGLAIVVLVPLIAALIHTRFGKGT